MSWEALVHRILGLVLKKAQRSGCRSASSMVHPSSTDCSTKSPQPSRAAVQFGRPYLSITERQPSVPLRVVLAWFCLDAGRDGSRRRPGIAQNSVRSRASLPGLPGRWALCSRRNRDGPGAGRWDRWAVPGAWGRERADLHPEGAGCPDRRDRCSRSITRHRRQPRQDLRLARQQLYL